MSSPEDIHEDVESILDYEVELSPEERERVAEKLAEYVAAHYVSLEEAAGVAIEARLDELHHLSRALGHFAVRRMEVAFRYMSKHIYERTGSIQKVAARESDESESKCDFCEGMFFSHGSDCRIWSADEPVYNKWGRCMTCGAEGDEPHVDCPFNTEGGDNE